LQTFDASPHYADNAGDKGETTVAGHRRRPQTPADARRRL